MKHFLNVKGNLRGTVSSWSRKLNTFWMCEDLKCRWKSLQSHLLLSKSIFLWKSEKKTQMKKLLIYILLIQSVSDLTQKHIRSHINVHKDIEIHTFWKPVKLMWCFQRQLGPAPAILVSPHQLTATGEWHRNRHISAYYSLANTPSNLPFCFTTL